MTAHFFCTLSHLLDTPKLLIWQPGSPVFNSSSHPPWTAVQQARLHNTTSQKKTFTKAAGKVLLSANRGQEGIKHSLYTLCVSIFKKSVQQSLIRQPFQWTCAFTYCLIREDEIPPDVPARHEILYNWWATVPHYFQFDQKTHAWNKKMKKKKKKISRPLTLQKSQFFDVLIPLWYFTSFVCTVLQ